MADSSRRWTRRRAPPTRALMALLPFARSALGGRLLARAAPATGLLLFARAMPSSLPRRLLPLPGLPHPPISTAPRTRAYPTPHHPLLLLPGSAVRALLPFVRHHRSLCHALHGRRADLGARPEDGRGRAGGGAAQVRGRRAQPGAAGVRDGGRHGEAAARRVWRRARVHAAGFDEGWQGEGGEEGGCRGSRKEGLHKKNGILSGLVVPVGRGTGGGGGEGDAVSTYKLTTLRVKQSSGSYCSFFLSFNYEDPNSQGGVQLIKSVKAVSIHPLTKDKFLVLDSAGVLRVFGLPNTEMVSEAASKQYCENIRTYCLDYAMKVQLFVVFPSSSTKAQIFWVSDGGHSVHIMSAFDVESPSSDNGDGDEERELATLKFSAHNMRRPRIFLLLNSKKKRVGKMQ